MEEIVTGTIRLNTNELQDKKTENDSTISQVC
jgi:hypothetical protein